MPIQFLPFVISGLSPAGAVAAVVGGRGVSGLQEFSRADIQATLLGATGDVLNLVVQSSWDGKHVGDPTKAWWDVAAYAQLLAASGPFNTLVTLIRSSSGAAPQALTTGGLLAAGTVLPNALGDALRLFAVPGPATSAGALQTLTVEMFHQA